MYMKGFACLLRVKELIIGLWRWSNAASCDAFQLKKIGKNGMIRKINMSKEVA